MASLIESAAIRARQPVWPGTLFRPHSTGPAVTARLITATTDTRTAGAMAGIMATSTTVAGATALRMGMAGSPGMAASRMAGSPAMAVSAAMAAEAAVTGERSRRARSRRRLQEV